MGEIRLKKAGSVRVASLSTLDNTVNSYKVLSSIQSILYSLNNGRCPSFLQPYLCLQPSLQSPPKIHSFTSDSFQLPIPPLLVCKIILTIPTKTLFLYTSATFHLQTVYTKNIFSASTIQPMQTASREQETRMSCDDQHCCNLFLLPQSMDGDNRAHNN